MRFTGQVNVAKFSREDWIYVVSFGVASFLQAIVATIQGPSYGVLFQNLTATDGDDGNFNDNKTIPSFDPAGTIPIIPNFNDNDNTNDVSATFFGFLLSFYQLFSFVLVPVIGIYVEEIGMKRVYMFGIYIAGATPFLSIMFKLFNPGSFLYFVYSFTVRALTAIGGVGMQVAIYMMITVLFPGRIATLFAVNQAMTTFGVALGGPIIFFLERIGGFALPSITFLLMGMIYVGFAMLVRCILPNLPAREDLHVTIKELAIRFVKFLIIPPILLFISSILITGVGNIFLQNILVPNLKQFDIGALSLALIPLLPSLLQLLSPIWGYVLDKVKRGEIVALIGALISTFSLLFIGPVPFLPFDETLWLTCLGLVFFGLGQGALIVASYFLILQEAEEHDLEGDMTTVTIISTSFVAAMSLGGGIGPILSGVFYDNYGFRYATLFPFSLYAFLAILVTIYGLKRRYFPYQSESGLLEEENFTEVQDKENEATETSPLLLKST